MRSSPLIVTGTDTGVGKTLVSRGLLAACRRAGLDVAPLKLVETGCVPSENELRSEDGAALARAAGRAELPVIAPLRFELPAAPRTAARRQGRELTFDELREHVGRARALAPHLLLEGAGGLLVPLAEQGTFGDFVATLSGARVLIVARDALGTLNHVLLTVEAARRRGLEVVGVVLNATSERPCPLEHAAELAHALPDVEVFGPLSWLEEPTDQGLADLVSAAGLTPERVFPLAG